MGDITSIFLAAGRGIRMGERGRMTPKGLLSMGGRTFCEEAVDTLRHNGLRNIRIVTGHLADQYEELVATRLDAVETRHNGAFTEKGSLHSLMVGLDGIDGPCLVLESDLVFEPRAVERVLADTARSALLVSGATGAGDEVYVWADERGGTPCLRDMSKVLDRWPDTPHGELVGLTYLTGEAVRGLRDVAPALLADDAMADYESGLVALAREHAITCPKVEDLAWAEVDNEDMLARATARVYPRIQAARAARSDS
jgi:choline kinase